MFKLTEEELDRAVRAIHHHGYSALVPPPPEWQVVQEHWATIRPSLAGLDLDTYRPYPHLRFYSPKSRINIRPVNLLHPQDLIIYTALTLIIKDDIEAARIPISKRRVFSYRARPSLKDHLYESNGSYDRYTSRRRAKARSANFVAVTDIADFYPRVYQHPLENVVRVVSRGERGHEIARVLVHKLINNLSGTKSYGIPVGPLASRLLAESVLIDVDAALMTEKFDFVRWVDDYTFFCKTRADAQRCLFFLAEWLFENHGLTLQPVKTRIMPTTRYLKRLRSNYEQRLKNRSAKLHKIYALIHTQDEYDSEPFDPDPQTRAAIENAPLVDLLRSAVKRRDFIDYELAEFILGKVGAIKDIDPKIARELIEIVLENLEPLYPIAESIARFFSAIGTLKASERRRIARALLKPLTHAKVRPPDFYGMWILHLFASAPQWGEADRIRAIYTSARSDVIRRYAALALAVVGNRSDALAVRQDLNGASPLLKTAILLCARKLADDERKHWKRANAVPWMGVIENAI